MISTDGTTIPRSNDWQDKHSECIWRCECGGPHFVSVTRWVTSDEHIAHLMLESYWDGGSMFWRRLRAAWQLLRGCYASWTEILLDPITSREIAAELLKGADQQERWERNHLASSPQRRLE